MYEIIHVVDPETLSGQVRHNLEIEAVDDHPLPAGYYFVLWPVVRASKRPPCKHYFGPFPTRAEARLLLRSAVALGLINDEQGVQSIAECRSIVRPPPAANGPLPLPLPPREIQQTARAA